MVNNFKNILDYNFTAEVEQSFDRIADGNQEWKGMIKGFYGDFHNTVNFVQENAERESGERSLGTDPKSGREVKVRLGKFGPIAQIGNADDEEKPVFASLTTEQQLDTITFEEAMELFQLPKSLEDYEGQPVTINNGRFGPYVKFGKLFVSLTKGASTNVKKSNGTSY